MKKNDQQGFLAAFVLFGFVILVVVGVLVYRNKDSVAHVTPTPENATLSADTPTEMPSPTTPEPPTETNTPVPTNPPPTDAPASPPTDTPTNKPETTPIPPTDKPVANTPTPSTPTDESTDSPTNPVPLEPMPLYPAVVIEDCSDTGVADSDCTSEMDEQHFCNTGQDSFRLIRWRKWPDHNKKGTTISIDDKILRNIEYRIDFLKTGDNPDDRIETILVPLDEVQEGSKVNCRSGVYRDNSGWLTYSFDLNSLPPDSCKPYWDVVVYTKTDGINCPSERQWGDKCQLTEYPDTQRSLGASFPGLTCGSSGGGRDGGDGGGRGDPGL